MQRVRLSWVIVLVLSARLALPADESGYSLGDCIRIGLERNAFVRNARRDRAISEDVIRQARAIVLPSVSLSATYTRLDEISSFEFGDTSVELGSVDNYEAGVSISQLLYSSGRASAALAAGRLTRAQSDWTLLEVEHRLVRDIETTFYDMLLREATVGVRRESVAHLEALHEQTRDKFRNGAAAEFDVITARVRLANEKPNLLQAENRRDLTRASFARLIGVDDLVRGVTGELTFQPWRGGAVEELKRRVRETRPAIQRLRCVVGLREQDLRSARSDGLPALRANASYTGANSYQYASFENEWEWHWNAGLTLEWDLWDGGLTMATVDEKERELAKARETLADAVREAELEITQAFLDMQYAQRRVEAGRDNVMLAEKALEIARARHESGLSTYLEFTDANLALSRARLNYLSAMHAHMNAVARLRHAAGILHPMIERGDP